MLRAITLSSLLLISASPPQDPPKSDRPPCCDEKGPKPWENYNKGVHWIQSMDDAVKKAREDNRILMVFQLVGDLDKEGC